MIWFEKSSIRNIVIAFIIVSVMTFACCFLFGEIENDEYKSLCFTACKKQAGPTSRVEFTTYIGYIKCSCYFKNSFIGIARTNKP